MDVGAGVGIDSMAFSDVVGPEGRVYAIEAHPKTYGKLLKTIKFNRLSNVVPASEAIMHKTCTVWIDRVADNGSAVSTDCGARHLPEGIQAVSLDEFCERHGVSRVDLIKMNIEGAERYAVQGMTEVLKRARAVSIACHDWRSDEGEVFRTKEIVVDFLRQSGFRVLIRNDDPRYYVRDHVHGLRD